MDFPGLRLHGSTNRHLCPISTCTFGRIERRGPFARIGALTVGFRTNKEVHMIATQDARTERAVRMTECSICQKMVRVNPLKASEVGVICRMCRCRRCSIPMSPRLCERCGVAHGTPSAEPGLCERCFESSPDHCGALPNDMGAMSPTLWSDSDDMAQETESDLLH